MRKKIELMLVFVLFLSTILFSQDIEFETRIIDTTTYWQLKPGIVFSEPSTIFLTWTDFFGNATKVFCEKSTDAGVSFLSPVEPDPGVPTKLESSIDIDGSGNPYLAWSDYRDGFFKIRFSMSNDGGASFIPSVAIDSDAVHIEERVPKIKVSLDGQMIFIGMLDVFRDTLGGVDSCKLYFLRSTDHGNTFSQPQHIGGVQKQQNAFSFDISKGGDTVAIAWQDTSQTNYNIFYSYSIDSGMSFSVRVNIDSYVADQFWPSLSLKGDSVYIVYTDNRNNNKDVRLAAGMIISPVFNYKWVNNDAHTQDQPAIAFDGNSNYVYVSYRSDEYKIGSPPMTSYSILKSNNTKSKDWIGIFGFDNTNSKIAVKDSLNIFTVWEFHYLDSMSLTTFARSVPGAPPGPPKNLLANGSNPSPWNDSTKFLITFEKPYDPSGISEVMYKLDTIPPNSNNDTTGTVPIDTFYTDTVSFVVYDNIEGQTPLFVWLRDGKGHKDYHNFSSVILRYDRTPPMPVIKIKPDSASTVTVRQPTFIWHPTYDSGGAGMMTYVVILDTSNNFDTVSTRYYFAGLDTFITIPDSLWDDVYYWTILPFDSAGSPQYNETIWNFLERATHPPNPVSPADSGWVAKNFVLIWNRVHDPLAYVDRYFVEIATDSGFNNIVFNNSTPGPTDTLMLINNWTIGSAFWHVRARNHYGVYTRWSQKRFFRYDSIPPPSPLLISPADGFITNNTRPTFNWHPVVDSQSGVLRYILAVFNDSTLYDTIFADVTTDTFDMPSVNLPDGNLYWIVLARDFAGNISAPGDTFLLTIDTQPPQVTTVIPSNGSAGVPVNSNIIVAFNEAMDSSSINDSTFTVIDNLSHRYYGTYQFNSSVDQLTFNPNENFGGGRNVLVTIRKDVKDLAQNKMGSDYTWFFVTESVNDSLGPIVYNLSITPDTVYLGQNILVTATVSDSNRGNSVIAGCELFVDSIGVDSTGNMFSPVDDSFDYVTEDVIDTLNTGSLSYKTTHWIYIHGLDVEGNWGSYDSLSFWVKDTLPPELSTTVSPDPSILGKDFIVRITSNKTLQGIDSCYIIDSYGNISLIDIERDSLDTDSTNFSKQFILSGLEPGKATLYVKGVDLYGKVGRDTVDFSINKEGEFLPRKRVYTWPNPASQEVHFRFYVNANANITIDVFTITGRKVVTLTKENAKGGDPNNEIRWDTRNVGSDVYIFRLRAESVNRPDKSTVIKRFAIVK